MANQTIKKLISVFCDVLVNLCPTYFILDCEDFKVLIILGWHFLVMGMALVDMEMGQIKFRLNNKQVAFNVSSLYGNQII